jgi:hypothetical protein
MSNTRYLNLATCGHGKIYVVYELVVTIRRILVNLTELQLAELDSMVKKGEYSNRAEAVREAARELIEKKKLEELEEKAV